MRGLLSFVVFLLFPAVLMAGPTSPWIWGTNRSAQNLADHATMTGAVPSITAGCGSSPTIAGDDSAGVVNVGTGGSATTCTITFNRTWTTVPHCFVQDETSQAITTTVVPSATTFVLTATAAWTSGSKIDYFCVNHL